MALELVSATGEVLELVSSTGQTLELVSTTGQTLELVLGNPATLLELADTPTDYTGAAGQALLVKDTEDGTEFGSAGVTAHGDLTGLLNDDHTQYLLVNGTRAMTGPLDLGSSALLTSDGADIVALRNGANAQELRLYGTYTDASNYERLSISHDGVQDAIIEAQSAGTGSSIQHVTIRANGTGWVTLDQGGTSSVVAYIQSGDNGQTYLRFITGQGTSRGYIGYQGGSGVGKPDGISFLKANGATSTFTVEDDGKGHFYGDELEFYGLFNNSSDYQRLRFAYDAAGDTASINVERATSGDANQDFDINLPSSGSNFAINFGALSFGFAAGRLNYNGAFTIQHAGDGSDGVRLQSINAANQPSLQFYTNATARMTGLFAYDSNELHMQNGANAQSLYIYGTRTDASNYERLSISHDGAATATIAAETAGTGANDQSIALSPAGVGTINLGGALRGVELSADPSDPSEGEHVIWQSDGTGSGDDGDIMIKITAGGTTKTVTLVDFSTA